MTEKEMFLNTYEREFQTTLRVLNAYPPDKLDFRPHEKSRSAGELAWVFVREERQIIEGALNGEIVFTQDKGPQTLEEIIAGFEKSHNEMVEKIRQINDAEFAKSVIIGAGVDDSRQIRRGDALWLAVNDAIHHRGQFSVYVRMAGGKVPSIYGPSADEPEN